MSFYQLILVFHVATRYQAGRFANANTAPKKESKQAVEHTVNSEEEESSNKFSFLDNVCCAPYKLILMPVTKLASVLAK